MCHRGTTHTSYAFLCLVLSVFFPSPPTFKHIYSYATQQQQYHSSHLAPPAPLHKKKRRHWEEGRRLPPSHMTELSADDCSDGAQESRRERGGGGGGGTAAAAVRRLSPKPWLPHIVLRLIHLDSPFTHFGTARCQKSSSPRVIKSTIAEQRVDQRDSGCNFQSSSHWESKHAKPTYNALSFGITVHLLPKTSKLKRPVPSCCGEIKLFPYLQPLCS